MHSLSMGMGLVGEKHMQMTIDDSHPQGIQIMVDMNVEPIIFISG